MFFVSEEYLRSYQESGDVGGSTLGEVAPPGESLFPAEQATKRVPKSKRGPAAKRKRA
jgi:hypothetical protein